MAPAKWDDEKESDSTPPSSPPPVALRRDYSDEEDDDSDVPDTWEDDDDSEVEREKAKKAEEAKAEAEAEAKANHKTKTQRIEEAIRRNKERKAQGLEEETFENEEDRVAYALQQEKESDLSIAADLWGDIGISNNRAVKPVVVAQSDDPTQVVDISTLPLFNPKTKDQFTKLRETLAPLLAANSKSPQYSLFLQEFTKAIARDLPSEQIKKTASGLTTLSNEKMREEKAAEKGGKKSKAAKNKTSLVASRNVAHGFDATDYSQLVVEEDDVGFGM